MADQDRPRCHEINGTYRCDRAPHDYGLHKHVFRGANGPTRAEWSEKYGEMKFYRIVVK